VDLDVRRSWPGPWGTWSWGVSGTYLFDYLVADGPRHASLSLLGTPANPVDLRLRSQLQWQRARLELIAAANYTDNYRDVVSEPNREIRHWLTFDLNVRYAAGPYTVAFTATNLTDEAPPLVNNSRGIGFDPENADLTGRAIRVSLTRTLGGAR